MIGASGSPGNLCAMRYAEHLARAAHATLIPVHAWIPPGGHVADRRCICAASGPKMPGSGCEKRSKLPGDNPPPT
jgi:hypothetical protein